jgi:hypothetical protein
MMSKSIRNRGGEGRNSGQLLGAQNGVQPMMNFFRPLIQINHQTLNSKGERNNNMGIIADSPTPMYYSAPADLRALRDRRREFEHHSRTPSTGEPTWGADPHHCPAEGYFG